MDVSGPDFRAPGHSFGISPTPRLPTQNTFYSTGQQTSKNTITLFYIQLCNTTRIQPPPRPGEIHHIPPILFFVLTTALNGKTPNLKDVFFRKNSSQHFVTWVGKGYPCYQKIWQTDDHDNGHRKGTQHYGRGRDRLY